MSRSRVTIRDVAALAGVSHQTVSRVINDSERVTPETRRRVEDAIAQLGYRPNAIARFMAKGRSATLACIAPNLTDYTFASLISGAEVEARQHDFFLLSASAPDEATFAALIDQLVTSGRTEGIIVINPYADGRHTYLPSNVPYVFAGARPREDAANSVALDDPEAAQRATGHLLQLGHCRIGLVTGPPVEDCTQDRTLGYERALQAAGIAPDPALVVQGNWLAPSGYEALMCLAQRGPLPTAVFAENDQMAVGVLRAARDLGIRVPDELSVIGIDDIPLAAYFEPPLTTLRQDFEAIGREAARLLIQAVAQPALERQHLRLPAGMIIRRSTAPPSSPGRDDPGRAA
ncbi:MAG: LacI family DNA-binding transcriptional regulator [Ardenticatenaceae bacterium]|nr:LacI family DNA-binding transcriptional regulator [Anaerolineales bacterium]MCB8919460.1 LacI family DNA-binding transcriptional regulator [Ardenticatenaceae bacterium]